MRVLVTGGSGFIGRRLIARLEAVPDTVVMNVDLTEGLDILDPTTAGAIQEWDPQLVFHLAAAHHVPWCREHPIQTHETNVIGTHAVLSSLGPSVEAVVLASSAAVYGFGPRPFAEASPIEPADVYGASKVAAEAMLRTFSRVRPRVRCIAARLFNVVGPGDQTPHVVPEIARAIGEGRPLQLGNLTSRRDFIHVADAAKALQQLASRAAVEFEVYNVGTGIGTSIAELVDIFSAEVGRRLAIQREPGRTRSLDGDLVADIGRIRWRIGWAARRPLSQAVHEVVEEQAAWA